MVQWQRNSRCDKRCRPDMGAMFTRSGATRARAVVLPTVNDTALLAKRSPRARGLITGIGAAGALPRVRLGPLWFGGFLFDITST